MAGEYVAIFGTELQMLETVRPVHNKGKAKSPIRVLPTAHQNLLPHLSLAFKLDFPNTCTKQWVWAEAPLHDFHLPLLLCSCLLPMNDGCWLCCTSPVGLNIIWTVSSIVFTRVLRVQIQDMLYSPLGILVNLAISFSVSNSTSLWVLGMLALHSLALI